MGLLVSIYWAITLIAMTLARWPLWLNSLAIGVALGITQLIHPSWLSALLILIFIPTALLLNVPFYRRLLLTKPIFAWYKKQLPKLSETEKTALDAGGLFWESQLFSGRPQWKELHAIPNPQLTTEEQAFLDGPVETFCAMLDDWDITHHRGCLPDEAWSFLKKEGFFSLIIPKQYGGRDYSAYCHSQVVLKIASRSLTAATLVTVPNSLGPGELISHYGTEEQKNYYLPRLASGEEIPCFALTSPVAGSDATAIPDTGVIKRGIFNGKEEIGIELNWDKRYITLAPIATLLGLAFKLYDPERLLGNQEEWGITCALIPTHLPNITIGRRHYPLNVPFQNGPTQGKNVFIPLSYIIGGPAMAGQGWKMLVECLSVGRAISLPSTTIGCAKLALFTTGAYARVREQFKQPIANFEGIKEAIAKMGGLTYIGDATRSLTAQAVDLNTRPSVAGAISKYHVTEISRRVGELGMDVQAGKAVMMGPSNLIARNYQGAGIAITVEGANILTRNMIIFGQGAIRCHPYVVSEMIAASNDSLKDFDKALFGHIGFFLSNALGTIIHGLSRGRLSFYPRKGSLQPYYRAINTASSTFALLSDLALLLFGGKLKFKENLSGRFADMLSYLYMASCCIQRFNAQGKPEDDRIVVEWCLKHLLHEFWNTTEALINNLPQRGLRLLLKAWIMPSRLGSKAPSDKLSRALADLLTTASSTRERLCQGIYMPNMDGAFIFEEALKAACEAAPVRERIAKVRLDNEKSERLSKEDYLSALLQHAHISKAEHALLLRDHQLRLQLIAVDDFEEHELVKS